MGINVKRCLSLATVIVVSLVLLNLSYCSATSLGSNDNTSQCNNRMDECLIADGDMESEFMVDSETNRMLVSTVKFQTANTGKLGPAVNCGRGKPDSHCLDALGNNKKGENSLVYIIDYAPSDTCHLLGVDALQSCNKSTCCREKPVSWKSHWRI